MYQLKLNKYVSKLKQAGGIYICNNCSPDVGDCPFCSNVKQMGGECNPLPTDLKQNELLSQESFDSIHPDRRYTLLSYEPDGTVTGGKINAVHPITKRKITIEQIRDVLTKYNNWITSNIGNSDLEVSDKLFDIDNSIRELNEARVENRDYGTISSVMLPRPLTEAEQELLAIEEERKAEERSIERQRLAQAEIDLARLRRHVQAAEDQYRNPRMSRAEVRRTRQSDDERLNSQLTQEERRLAAIEQQRNLYRNDNNVSNLPRVSGRVGYEADLSRREREWRRGM